MIQPNYSIGQTVYICIDSQLQQKTIKKIHIRIEKKKQDIRYVFEEDIQYWIDIRLRSYFDGTPEEQVFLSPKKFIEHLGIPYLKTGTKQLKSGLKKLKK